MTKNVGGRPVGARIREVLVIAEKLGPCTAPQIRALMQGDVEASNAAKYCSRAVGLRLMTVDRSSRLARFQPVPGWRELISVRTPAPRVKRPEPPVLVVESIVARALRTHPNSVFALGGEVLAKTTEGPRA